MPPFVFTLDRPGLARFVEQVDRVIVGRGEVQVEVGVEAAGHYHRPVTASSMLPTEWTLVELNPSQVTEQRRVLGKRGIETDQIDLAAMFDLLAAGRGLLVAPRCEALQQLQAWAAMRHRRIAAVIAVKNQLLGQMDRAFPGASRCVAGSLLDTKVGRLAIAEFTDPVRLTRLGVERFRRFAAARDVLVDRKVAQRFVAAARAALPLDGASTARELSRPASSCCNGSKATPTSQNAASPSCFRPPPFAVLTTTPGWATVRAGRYGAALGEPTRWPTARQVCRASGLTPKTYESAGVRYEGKICREGPSNYAAPCSNSAWACGCAMRPAAATPCRSRLAVSPPGTIACAMAHRANKIAFAMVRDQTRYTPHWSH